MNKREKEAYERYRKSNIYSLYDAYGTFSKAKEEAWDYCRTVL